MKVAMGVLAFLALVGGLIQIPGVDDVIDKLLEPVFEDSPLAHIHPTLAPGLGSGLGDRRRRSRSSGSGSPTSSTSPQPERPPASLIQRLRPLYTLFVNKWYFDELIDLLVVRPALAIGRFANRVFERFVVDGLVSGTEGTRARRRRRRPRRPERLRPQLRAAPDRRLRRARPLLPAEQLMINSLLWTPLAFGLVGLFLPRRAGRLVGDAGGGRHAGARDRDRRSASTPAAPACSTRSTSAWISGLGVDYSLGIDGLNLFLVAADRGALGRRHRLRRLPRAGAPAALLLPDAGRRDGDAGRLPRSGPAALRPLLRLHAGPVLLPLRLLGQTTARAARRPRRRR